MARQRKVEYWIIWSQHWMGNIGPNYRPSKHGEYKTEKEANEALERLNASPSAQWFGYSLEHVPAKEQNQPA